MVLGSALASLHEVGAWVVMVGNGVAGVWALVAHRYPAARHRSLWIFTIAVQVGLFVQVALGVAYQQSEGIDATPFHDLYGFASLFAVAIIFAYREQLSHKLYLLYGGGGLFLMGMCIRAMVLHA